MATKKKAKKKSSKSTKHLQQRQRRGRDERPLSFWGGIGDCFNSRERLFRRGEDYFLSRWTQVAITGKRRTGSLVWRQTFRQQYFPPLSERAFSLLPVGHRSVWSRSRCCFPVVEDELGNMVSPDLPGGEGIQRKL